MGQISPMNWQLAGFDSDRFINEYWQKKPCLIRQAFANVETPISPEELAGLACEEDVHSRLVLEKGGESAWQLRYGPFSESDFTTLPDSHYSLLVSECEKWIPELANLVETFNFVPSWRMDDIMISYAPPGGSVGPHVDEYDVFLLQLQGQRRWKYDENRMAEPALIPGLDLAILESFNAEQNKILEPGDMLYLPPGVAHHGIAVDACLTCSVGFRAPTASEILESVALEIDKQELGLSRYSDENLETNRHPAEITQKEVKHFKQMATKLLEQPQSLWIDAVGKLLSDTVISNEGQGADFSNLEQLQSHTWIVNPNTRMLYHREDPIIHFYFNGQCADISASDTTESFIQQLCSVDELTLEMLEIAKSQPQLTALLVKMANSDAIIRFES